MLEWYKTFRQNLKVSWISIPLFFFGALTFLVACDLPKKELKFKQIAADKTFHDYIHPIPNIYSPSLNQENVPLDVNFTVLEFGDTPQNKIEKISLVSNNGVSEILPTQTQTRTDAQSNIANSKKFELGELSPNTSYRVESKGKILTTFTTTTQKQGTYAGLYQKSIVQNFTIDQLKADYKKWLGLNSIESKLLASIAPNIVKPPFKSSVSVAYINYYTKAPDGQQILASGYVAYPSDLVNKTHDEINLVSYQKYTGENLMRGSNGRANISKKHTVGQMIGKIAATNGQIFLAPAYIAKGAAADLTPAYLNSIEPTTLNVDLMKAFGEFFNTTYPKNPIDLANAQLTLLGYSQGGYTTMSLMQGLLSNKFKKIKSVYSGEGPYNLYDSVVGAAQATVDNRTNDYSRNVIVPLQASFMKDLIIPSFRKYFKLNINDHDIFRDFITINKKVIPTFKKSFAEDFLNTHKYDDLKYLLFANSLTNYENIAVSKNETVQEFMVANDINFPINLYQNKFDQLIANGNVEDMQKQLSSDVFNSISSVKRNCTSANTHNKIIEILDKLIIDIFQHVPILSHVNCAPFMVNEYFKELARSP